MIWNSHVMHRMKPGESILVTEDTQGNPLLGQGDVTYLFGRKSDAKFTTKTMILTDPKTLESIRCIKVTRVDTGDKDAD